jgi:hypothetical protein
MKEKLFTIDDMKQAFEVGYDSGQTCALFHNTDQVSRREYEQSPNFETFIKDNYQNLKID